MPRLMLKHCLHKRWSARRFGLKGQAGIHIRVGWMRDEVVLGKLCICCYRIWRMFSCVYSYCIFFSCFRSTKVHSLLLGSWLVTSEGFRASWTCTGIRRYGTIFLCEDNKNNNNQQAQRASSPSSRDRCGWSLQPLSSRTEEPRGVSTLGSWQTSSKR